MESIKMFVIFFASLMAVTSAMPPQATELSVDLSKAQGDQEYVISKHGKRVLGDKLLSSGQCIRHLTKEKVAERINLNTTNEHYVISYVEFRYIDMSQDVTKTSVSVINGGAGSNFVGFLVSSESSVVYLNYYIYGMTNTCGSIPTKKVWEVNSEEDLETKLEEAQGKLVVLFFAADWLVAAKSLERMVEKTSLNNLGVVFLRIDSDKLSSISKKYNVDTYPTFVFMKLGKEISRTVGPEGAEEKIKEVIKQQQKS